MHTRYLVLLSCLMAGIVGCTPQWSSVLNGELPVGSQPVATKPGEAAVEARIIAPADRRSQWAAAQAPVKAPAESQRLQGTSAGELQQKIWSHFTEHVGRQLYIQTDKALYRPQETVWIKTWDMQVRSMRGYPLDTGVLYQLVSPSGEVLTHKVVRQVFGEATNELEIPAGAVSGEYLVRVLTEDDVSSVRSIVVVGASAGSAFGAKVSFGAGVYRAGEKVTATVSVDPARLGKLRRKAVPAVVMVDGVKVAEVPLTFGRDGRAEARFALPGQLSAGQGTLEVTLADGGQTEWVVGVIPIDNTGLRLTAYPEGGHLVAGLPSRVYFEAWDDLGAPVSVSGWIEDDRGRQVTPFETSQGGMGRFALTPEAGRSYKAVVTAGIPFKETFPLPAVAEGGCTLSTLDDFDTQRAAVRVQIWCKDPTSVLVTAMVRETVMDVAYVLADATTPAVVFLRSKDRDVSDAQGIVRVTVWDDWLEPQAERLVYRNRQSQLDLQVIPSVTALTPGEPVDLHVFARGPGGEPVAAKVALAMVDQAVLDVVHDDYGTILSHLFLESELVGPIRDPSQYFEPSNAAAGEGLDLLMGTRGYRTFAWREVVEPKEHEGPRTGTSGAIVVQAPDFGAKASRVDDLHARPGAIARTRAVAARLAALDPRYAELPVTIVPVAALPAADAPEGAAAKPAPPTEGAVPAAAGPRDRLSREDVLNTVRRYQYRLGRCSEGSHVVVAVKMTVKSDGSVEGASVVNEAQGTKVAECVLKAVSAFAFPTWTGEPLALTFPFVMEGLGWSPVRVFAVPAPDRDIPSRLNDRRETVLWLPELTLDAEGHAVVTVPTSNVATTFRAVAEGAGAGWVGRGEAQVTSEVPFGFKVRVPSRIAVGDEVVLPVELENLTGLTSGLDVIVQVGPGLERVSGGGETVRVEPHARGVERVRVRGVGTAAGSFIKVIVQRGAVRQERVQAVDVTALGFSRTASRSGLLTAPVSDTMDLSRAQAGSVRAELRLFPNELGQLMAARDGLNRSAVGGVSEPLSVAWIDAQALTWTAGSGIGGEELRKELRAEGLARLDQSAAYGVDGGLAAWLDLPADVVWTAWAAVVLGAWKGLAPDATAGRLTELASFVLDQRDGAGGYRRPSALEGPGHPSKGVVNAFVTWAMSEAGAEGFDAEYDALKGVSEETKDAFVMALATDTLLNVPRLKGPAYTACRKLAGMQDASGAWTAVDHTVWRSGVAEARTATSALALRALMKCGAFFANIRKGAAWLMGQQRADGTFGSGPVTGLAVDAIVRYGSHGKRGLGPGEAAVKVNGGSARTLPYDVRAAQAPSIADLGSAVASGAWTIDLTHTGRGELPFLVSVVWSEEGPPAPLVAAVSLTASLDRTSVALDETTTLAVEATNTTGESAPVLLVSVGVPSGLTVSEDALKALRASGTSVELDAGAGVLRMALLNVGGGEARKLAVPMRAVSAGIYTGRSSTAELFGREETRVFAAGLKVSVGASPR